MTHPLSTAVATVRAALKDVADADPVFLSTGEKADLLVELVRAESQLAGLTLRVLAQAGDVAETGAAHDIAGWLRHETRASLREARTAQRLAEALDRRYPAAAAALREGRLTRDQAEAIVSALDALPAELDRDILARAETALVGYASAFDPTQLRRLGRRILDVAAPEIADESEARHLAALEADAARRTRLLLRPLGDGTTRITGLLPDRIATALAAQLWAFTNPRKAERPAAAQDRGSTACTRLPYPRRVGEAFCQLVETLDPARLPIHGGDATTLVVTLSLDALRHGLRTAELPGATGEALDRITATQARRLACTAKIIPAVLGADGQLLDLGRARRLFTPAQRKALLVRDRTCRAEGCDIPGTWSEAHHWQPWSQGGPTDLGNAVLLCSHHHHRAHDPAHRPERLASGDIRFHRRT